MNLDNSKCETQCFKHADTAAEFIAQSMRHGWKPEVPIYSVQCKTSSSLLIEYKNGHFDKPVHLFHKELLTVNSAIVNDQFKRCLYLVFKNNFR